MSQTLAIVDNSEAAAKLDAVAASGCCQSGGVLLLDFSAIRVRLESRWQIKRETVWSRLDQIILSHVGHGGLAFRSSDVEYVVSFSEERGLAAQAIGFRIMEAGLTHFLGGYELADLAVYAVPDITESGIQIERVRSDEVERAIATTAPKLPKPLLKPPSVALTGVADRLSFVIDPQEIRNVRSEKLIGTRFGSSIIRAGSPRPLTSAERAELPTQALLQVDLNVTTRVVSKLSECSDMSVFILPLSLSTILSSHARGPILAVLQSLTNDEASHLLIEMTGVSEGTPLSRIIEASVLVKGFCRSVLSQTVLSKGALGILRQGRFQGVTVSARELGATDQKIAANLLVFGQAIQGIAAAKMAVDLPAASFLPVCAVAGLTHASFSQESNPSSALSS